MGKEKRAPEDSDREFAERLVARIRSGDLKKDLAAGKVEFGRGYGTGEYPASYIAAARTVVDDALAARSLHYMAAPCIYLQRHALELLLKRILFVVLEIESMQASLSEGRRVAVGKVPGTHDLLSLCERTVAALAKRGLEPPKDLPLLVREISEFEDGDPTRTRYDRGAKGKGYEESSFPDWVSVPVLDWQNRLEGLVPYLTIQHEYAGLPERTLAEELWSLSVPLHFELLRLKLRTPDDAPGMLFMMVTPGILRVHR